jgi:hypothetical protein
MIKRNSQFSWGSKEKEAFGKIKEDINQALSLLSPYFDQDFILYTFSSHTNFATVLTQKNSERDGFSVGYEFRPTRSSDEFS